MHAVKGSTSTSTTSSPAKITAVAEAINVIFGTIT